MIEGLEKLLEWGGTKRSIAFLAVSGVALVLSLAGVEPFPFSIAWVAIILCGVPIILEAVIGLVTEFDMRARSPSSCSSAGCSRSSPWRAPAPASNGSSI